MSVQCNKISQSEPSFVPCMCLGEEMGHNQKPVKSLVPLDKKEYLRYEKHQP